MEIFSVIQKKDYDRGRKRTFLDKLLGIRRNESLEINQKDKEYKNTYSSSRCRCDNTIFMFFRSLKFYFIFILYKLLFKSSVVGCFDKNLQNVDIFFK
jgi:hypothetical protein